FVAARSYIIKKQIPGVYFYDAPNCKLATGGDSSSLPQYSTKSIPEWSDTKAVKSILVVNGPDPKKGPFFGAVLFNDQDYKTNIIPMVMYINHDTNLASSKNYSNCVDTSNLKESTEPVSLHSVAIYQWAGFKDNSNEPNINCSVNLYSRSNWTGGYYQISPQSEGTSAQYWIKELKKIPIKYPPGTSIPVAEQQQCDKFYPTERCLQSFEIKGNCLVVVASDKTTNSHAQAFPISPRLIQAYGNRPVGYSIERGTPELENDYITSGYSYFIDIIPLSVKITE
ncbi:MAG: hypothetical protein Q7K54_01470, partial [Candidatus Parcubacteria bacterium]|nr:hypothetical protein [Candidatus Parcubacteria bacterium]